MASAASAIASDPGADVWFIPVFGLKYPKEMLPSPLAPSKSKLRCSARSLMSLAKPPPSKV